MRRAPCGGRFHSTVGQSKTITAHRRQSPSASGRVRQRRRTTMRRNGTSRLSIPRWPAGYGTVRHAGASRSPRWFAAGLPQDRASIRAHYPHHVRRGPRLRRRNVHGGRGLSFRYSDFVSETIPTTWRAVLEHFAPAKAADDYLVADRFTLGPPGTRHGFIDHDHRRRGCRIGGLEHASTAKRNLHGFEVRGSNHANLHAADRILGVAEALGRQITGPIRGSMLTAATLLTPGTRCSLSSRLSSNRRHAPPVFCMRGAMEVPNVMMPWGRIREAPAARGGGSGSAGMRQRAGWPTTRPRRPPE